MLQLRNRTALVKDVSDKATQNVQLVSEKATQNVPIEKKEDIEEEMVEEKKEEKEGMNGEEEKVDVKNVSQALPLRRSARAARKAIVKVDQVRFLFLPFLPLFSPLSPFFLRQVEVGGKGRQHLRILRGLRGSEELEIGEEEDHSDEEFGKVTTVGQVGRPPLSSRIKNA